MGARPRILFLCTGNSCRSQMAEGFARQLRSDVIQAFSAGTRPKGIDPRAVEVMREVGIDISGGSSKAPEDLDVELDVVVTVCDSAHETCPTMPGAPRIVHVGFDDPPRLASGAATEDEAIAHYRRVRDEIESFVRTLPGSVIGDAW